MKNGLDDAASHPLQGGAAWLPSLTTSSPAMYSAMTGGASQPSRMLSAMPSRRGTQSRSSRVRQARLRSHDPAQQVRRDVEALDLYRTGGLPVVVAVRPPTREAVADASPPGPSAP